MKTKLAEVEPCAWSATSPTEFAAFLAKEVEKFSVLVKAANIKAE